MTIKTTVEQRRLFWQRHLRGETYHEIADAFGLSCGCVRYWCRRQRDGGSVQTINQRKPAGLLSRFDPLVRYVLLRLRLQHPRWGPGTLRYHMSRRPSLQGIDLPSVAQIGRYLHQWPRFRRKRKQQKQKRTRPNPATREHERWQVDFKLGIPLLDGTQVNMHTVRDEVGAVCITASATLAGPVGQPARRVTRHELQTTLRAGFLYWQTLPEEVQTDGEPVFVGHTADSFPSKFTLWLAGLGIRHRIIRPGKPTDNAEVERANQTLDAYVIAGNQHLSAPELQRALLVGVEELAFHLPSQAHGCKGQPPVVAHPLLLARPRPFAPEQELALFDLHLVDAYLAQFTWERKVGKTGQICIGGHHQYYSVGRAFARQYVQVRFDPSDRHFVFFAESDPGTEIGRRPARNLEVEDITGLVQNSDDDILRQLSFPFYKGYVLKEQMQV